MPEEIAPQHAPIMQQQVAIPAGFMSKMLEAMPKFVTGLVGSFLGISLSFVIVLKIGGMDVAFARVIAEPPPVPGVAQVAGVRDVADSQAAQNC